MYGLGQLALLASYTGAAALGAVRATGGVQVV